MVYNSVDQSYFRQASDKINQLFNSEKMQEFKQLEKKQDIPALKRPIEEIDGDETDEEILMLEKIIAEKRAKKKQQQDEM